MLGDFKSSSDFLRTDLSCQGLPFHLMKWGRVCLCVVCVCVCVVGAGVCDPCSCQLLKWCHRLLLGSNLLPQTVCVRAHACVCVCVRACDFENARGICVARYQHGNCKIPLTSPTLPLEAEARHNRPEKKRESERLNFPSCPPSP